MKLIRDNTPGLMKRPGVTRAVKSEEEMKLLLRMKVMEEAAEVAAATSREEMIEELADLLDVAQAIMSHNHIDPDLVISASRLKKDKKGGFDNGVILMFDPLENKNS
jgi:predicted house-cleaning noncanonical NTP pyrophosphatase (MazG superfamily)